MGEVYTLDECVIKRVGSASGDSTETSISAYATDIRVSIRRKLLDRRDHQGLVLERIPVNEDVQVDISKLYVNDPYLFDGNSVALYWQNVTGTEKHVVTGCYWESKDWNGSPLRQDVTLKGNTWSGTTT